MMRQIEYIDDVINVRDDVENGFSVVVILNFRFVYCWIDCVRVAIAYTTAQIRAKIRTSLFTFHCL